LTITWNNARGEKLTRSFYHQAKKRTKALSKEIEFQIKQVDLEKKVAILEVKNRSFLQDFWLYSMQLGVTFDKNFIHLLPGTHEFQISFEQVPTLNSFGMHYLKT
jgi:hypothetical protein